MRFKVNDLMINILPEANPKEALACGACTRCSDCSRCSGCTRCSDCSRCTGCSRCTFWSCDMMSCMYDSKYPFPYLTDPSGSPEALSTLKEQLRQELAQLEQQETELQGSEPQTVEEIDAIEAKLKDALKELQARRKELQRGGKK